MNSKAKAKKKPATGEDRLVCTNWDKESPIRVERHGEGHCISRKVLTKGELQIEASEILEEAVQLLRQGYEVRLTSGGEEAIRLYPCVEQDMTTMFVAARTMGKFRSTLAKKKTKVIHRGEETSAEAMVELNKELKGQGVHVSPEMTVTCPKCGTVIRVGKKLV